MESFSDYFRQQALLESPDNLKTEDGSYVEYNGDPRNLTFSIYNDKIYYGPSIEGILHPILNREILSDSPVMRAKVNAWPSRVTPEERSTLIKEIERKRQKEALNVRHYNGSIVAGRYFPKHNIISFWNRKSEVEGSLDVLGRFLSHANVDVNDIKFETIESKGFWTKDGNHLKNSADVDMEEFSDEEVKELMMRQHLDPNAKKALRKRAGYPKSKKPLGYDTLSKYSD